MGVPWARVKVQQIGDSFAYGQPALKLLHPIWSPGDDSAELGVNPEPHWVWLPQIRVLFISKTEMLSKDSMALMKKTTSK